VPRGVFSSAPTSRARGNGPAKPGMTLDQANAEFIALPVIYPRTIRRRTKSYIQASVTPLNTFTGVQFASKSGGMLAAVILVC